MGDNIRYTGNKQNIERAKRENQRAGTKAIAENSNRRRKNSRMKNSKKRKILKGAIVGIAALIGVETGGLVITGYNNGKLKKEISRIENENNQLREENEFLKSLKVEANSLETQNKNEAEKEIDEILEEFIEEHNEMYNDNLTKESIGGFKSNPMFIIKNSNEDYIQDNNYEMNPDEGEEVIETDSYKDGVYSLIDRRSNSIIASIADIDGEISNVYTARIMDSEGNMYFSNGNNENILENKENL